MNSILFYVMKIAEDGRQHQFAVVCTWQNIPFLLIRLARTRIQHGPKHVFFPA